MTQVVCLRRLSIVPSERCAESSSEAEVKDNRAERILQSYVQSGPEADLPKLRSLHRTLLVAAAALLTVAVLFALVLVLRPSEDTTREVNSTGGPSPVSQTPGATQTILWTPYDETEENPAPGLTIAERAVASDCIGSTATMREEARRCFAGHDVYDPCWLPSDWTEETTSVLCGFPGVESVTQLVLAKKPEPLVGTRPADILQELPLSIVLTTGLQCNAHTGAGEIMDGLRSSFACPKSPSYEFTFGEPDRSSDIWTIGYRVRGATELVSVDIVTAYF